MLGKVLEVVIVNRILPYISATQSRMQRGFTAGVAPLNAALLVTEMVNEYKDQGRPLTVTMMDAEKAFDVVWIDELLRTLYKLNLPAPTWKLLCNWYTKMSCRVRWQGETSEAYRVRQGVGQGRTMSAYSYKLYIDPLLHSIEDRRLGASFGNITCGVVGCADDIALLAGTPEERQTLVGRVLTYGSKKRSTNNIGKTIPLEYNSKQKTPAELTIQGQTVKTKPDGTHIGVIQAPQKANQLRVKNAIATARRTLYSLFGAGLHGKNGLNPKYTIQIWKTMVLPVLLSGAEVWALTQAEAEPLEMYQKRILKQLQGMADNTASAAVYLLSGVLPITAALHIKTLMYYRHTISDPNSVEYALARRQLVLKDESSSSWYIYVEKLAHQYGLPSPYELLQHLPTKTRWKQMVKRQIHTHWKTKLEADALVKKSLRYMSATMTVNAVVDVWETSTETATESNKDWFKVQVLTGTYRLQALAHRQNQHEVDATCMLCKTGDEDRLHFISTCSALEEIRRDKGMKIASFLERHGWDPVDWHEDPELFLTACTDCRGFLSRARTPLPYAVHELERLSRDLLFHLHRSRWVRLKTLAEQAH